MSVAKSASADERQTLLAVPTIDRKATDDVGSSKGDRDERVVDSGRDIDVRGAREDGRPERV